MVTFIKVGNNIINTDKIITINLENECVEIRFDDSRTRSYGDYSKELRDYFSGKGSTLRIGNEGNMIELIKVS